MERTFDVPQAAAGPLVTPTKPIFSSLSAACDQVAPAAKARIEAPQSAEILMRIRLPNMRFSLQRVDASLRRACCSFLAPVDSRFSRLSTILFYIVYDLVERRRRAV